MRKKLSSHTPVSHPRYAVTLFYTLDEMHIHRVLKARGGKIYLWSLVNPIAAHIPKRSLKRARREQVLMLLTRLRKQGKIWRDMYTNTVRIKNWDLTQPTNSGRTITL